jgi:hypothetical protein
MFVEINEDKFVNLDRVFSIETMKISDKYVCKFHIGEGLEETSKAFETESEARRWLRETVL